MCPRSCWLHWHANFELCNRISSRKQNLCKTVHGGAQIECLKLTNLSRKSKNTVPLICLFNQLQAFFGISDFWGTGNGSLYFFVFYFPFPFPRGASWPAWYRRCCCCLCCSTWAPILSRCRSACWAPSSWWLSPASYSRFVFICLLSCRADSDICNYFNIEMLYETFLQ